ncbi:MAG: hypothetical protein J6U54_07260 [Clostridiales bacterium]|nr:hypothetical protein [Clostridiales bacterium]
MANKKQIKKIAKTVGGAVGGAVIRGGSAAIDVVLAPIYVASSAVTGAIDGAFIANHKKTINERIDMKLEKMKK